MVLWVVLSACGEEPAPVPDPGRVLAGPLLGAAVAVSDPDGDGHAALWVSAPGVDGSGGIYRFDGPDGTLADAPGSVVATEPGTFGGAFAPCGDLDGDGVEDLIAGSPDRGGRGGTWWIHGPLAGVFDDASWLEGSAEAGHDGTTVACGDGGAGTVVAIAAPDADSFGTVPDSGQVGLFRQDAGAIDKIASVDTTWNGSRLGFRSGLGLGADLDGDGTGDLAIGGSGADRVHLVFGPFAGSYVTNSAGPTFTGGEAQGTGHALASGDVNGDGAPDLVIGAPFANGDQGLLWIVPGPFGGDDRPLANVGTAVLGIAPGGQAGFSVAVVGDVDDDGADDLLVGAPGAEGAGPEAGAAYLVLGPGAIPDLDGAAAMLTGDVAYGRLGWAVTGGDVDGDGSVDLVVGAPEADVDGRIGAGVVYTFPGSVRGTVRPDAAMGRIEAGR